MMSKNQIEWKIKELKKELAIYENILNSPNKYNSMGRPIGSIRYTPEQILFLQKCEDEKIDDKEIIQKFNKKFKENVKPNSRQLYNFMVRQGIRKQEWKQF